MLLTQLFAAVAALSASSAVALASPALKLAQTAAPCEQSGFTQYSRNSSKHAQEYARHDFWEARNGQRGHRTVKSRGPRTPGSRPKRTSTAAVQRLTTTRRVPPVTTSTTTKKPVAAPTTNKPKPTTTKPKSTTTTTKPKPEPSTTAAPQPPPAPTSGGSKLQTDSLKAHNDFRAKHGAVPLTWDAKLEASAQAWADRCVFEHGGGKALSAGENLAAMSDVNASAASQIKMWTDEASEYDPANPQYSHFTQVVWKNTSKLGCAKATCSPLQGTSFSGQFFVCHYLAHGNVLGQFAANVQK